MNLVREKYVNCHLYNLDGPCPDWGSMGEMGEISKVFHIPKKTFPDQECAAMPHPNQDTIRQPTDIQATSREEQRKPLDWASLEVVSEATFIVASNGV